MQDIIQKALAAKRESKQVEFKKSFDPDMPGEWCELIKDIVAIANSDGGIIIFGLDNAGSPIGHNVDSVASIDPADFANKVSKYTGPVDLEFEIQVLKKQGHELTAFVIQPISVPIVFQKPGTYDVGGGKQRTAFSTGTVYFRHGAKSEVGNSEDIRRVFERQIERLRKSWIKGVKKVVQAPPGSQIMAFHANHRNASLFLSGKVRTVNDPNAIPVRLTRDTSLATGTFVHEEISDGIFDEINNVLDANRALTKGRQDFVLGAPVYYRIYAERHHVIQKEDNIALLLQSAVINFYAPFAYWIFKLSPQLSAKPFAELCLQPKSPNIHCLLRLAILLGNDFCVWLYEKWSKKWEHYPQPPGFYWTFKDMFTNADKNSANARLFIASHLSLSSQVAVAGEKTISVKTLIDKPEQTATFLSKVCMQLFVGKSVDRTMARNLDFLAYGHSITAQTTALSEAIIKAVGNRQVVDEVQMSEKES